MNMILLVILLAWLGLGRLHEVHWCIIFHRWVLCWGVGILRSLSLVYIWLLGGSSSVSVPSCVLGPLCGRVRSSLLMMVQ